MDTPLIQVISLADKPRELAFKTLLAAEKDHSRAIDDLLSNILQKTDLSQQDKRWIMELVYGVTRMKLQLDAMIESAFKGRYHKAQHAVKTLLRMGSFQLKHMHTSEHAAINETVSLSRKVKQSQAAGLINAVLRKIQTMELSQILDSKKDGIERLSIETSHPEWLLSRWVSQYSMEDVHALCKHNNTAPASWLRRNALVVEQIEFEAFLTAMDIVFQRSEILDVFYKIDSAASLFSTREFHKGWFSFQDLAAGIVASLMDPKPGETIVDACAAPGGKMAFISEMSAGQAHIVACDASQSRLIKVEENIRRLDLKQVIVKQLDATNSSLPEADRILLDVPCSGTGVLNRRADARWKRTAGDIDSLVEIQTAIVENCWKYLKPGGLMLYATCTLEPEENWAVIDALIPGLEQAEIEAIDDEKLKPYIDERGALSTLPWSHGMDGMFGIKIRKTI